MASSAFLCSFEIRPDTEGWRIHFYNPAHDPVMTSTPYASRDEACNALRLLRYMGGIATVH